MAGFANDIVYANNGDFSIAGSSKGQAANGLNTDGQLWVGRTSVNAGGTHISVGKIISPLGTLTIGYSAPNITMDLTGGATAIEKINLQTGTTPIVPTSGAITFNGAVVAAGINPVRTDGTGASTVALEVQTSQALAAADATKIGLCNFDSSSFAVTATGFVTLAGGSEAVDSFSPDSGTDPVVPTAAGLVNDKGSGSITTVGSLNTITTQLTGLTNHAVLVGAGTTTITKLGVGTNGQVLLGSTAADPVFATLTSSDSSISFTTGAGTLSLQTAKAFSQVVTQIFTGNGTYTPTSGMKYCILEVVGGGGGGGGANATGATTVACGGGGAGGGYSRLVASAATIGGSQTVTVGAAGTAGTNVGGTGGTGGTTSVGSLLQATGGVGGNGTATPATTVAQNGGFTPGVGSIGTLNLKGSGGHWGYGSGTAGLSAGIGGNGGSSALGGGAYGAVNTLSGAGTAGGNYGGGGSGAGVGLNQGTGAAGGAGAAGVVFVTEFV